MARTDLEQLVYAMSTDLRALEKQNSRALAVVKKTAGDIEGRYARMDDNVRSRMGKADWGKALDKTFDRSRLAVIEAGATRVPIFADAIESMGPAGLAGAAGIAALAVSAHQALRAMEFADDVADTAAKINVGVEALQEWRLVARELGADMGDADAALEGFMKNFGAARSGLSAKALKPFEALGFTQADLKNVKDGDQLLGQVIDRIAGLSNAAEQAAVAEKLGLGPLLPVIREGRDAIAETSAKMRELGLIMDAEMIKRGADAQAQFETLSSVIDMNLKAAFIDLAPAIVAIVGLLADAARAGRDFVETFKAIEDRSTAKLDTDIARAQKARSVLVIRYGSKLFDGTAEPTALAAYKRWNDRIDELMKERWKRGQASATPTLPTVNLIDTAAAEAEARRRMSSARKKDDDPIRRRDADPIELISQDEIDRNIEAIQLQRDLAEAQALGDDARVEALERELDLRRRIADYQRAGVSDEEAIRRAKEDAESYAGAVASATADKQRDQLKGSLLRAFDAARGGAGSLADYFGERMRARLLEGVAEVIANMLMQLQASSAASGGGGGGGGGWVSAAVSTLASAFGGGRANGGRANRGTAYVVGERRPEVFVPDENGHIIPNLGSVAPVSRSAIVHQYFTVNAEGSILSTEVFARIEHMKRQAVAEAVPIAVGRATDMQKRAGPGLLAQHSKLQG